MTTLLGANAPADHHLRAICNMVRSTGAIEFDGATLAGAHRKHRSPRIAHVPQARHLHDHDGGREPAARRDHAQDKAGVVSDIERMYDHFRC